MTKTQLAFFGTESKSGSLLQGLNEGLLFGALCIYIYYKKENNQEIGLCHRHSLPWQEP